MTDRLTTSAARLAASEELVRALALERQRRTRWRAVLLAVSLVALYLFGMAAYGTVSGVVPELTSPPGRQLASDFARARLQPEAERIAAAVRPDFEQAFTRQARTALPRLARELPPALDGLADAVARRTAEAVQARLARDPERVAGDPLTGRIEAAAAEVSGELAGAQARLAERQVRRLLTALATHVPAAGAAGAPAPIAERWSAVGEHLRAWSRQESAREWWAPPPGRAE